MYLLHNYRGALRAPLDVHDKVHTVAAEAAAPAAAPAAALAAAPAADPWIHGYVSFMMKHIFYDEMKNTQFRVTLIEAIPGDIHVSKGTAKLRVLQDTLKESSSTRSSELCITRKVKR